MATITASGLTKHIGARTLWSGIAMKLEPGDRMSLSGRNGSGKTTLLRTLAGELTPDEGMISLGRGARVALHDQRPPRVRSRLREYVTGGLRWILEIERELERLEARMVDGDAGAATLAAYADAQARLEHAGGYRWRDGVELALRGLGFDPDEYDRPLSGFSGGELTRASLARVLASKPDLLLLDEPTNHLDIESLEWLEHYLTELDAAVVLVAHDRWFLEAVGTSVLELDGGRGRFFAGPWHAWRAERAVRELAADRDAARREAEIARMQRFVERFRYKATKARQAQSRVKMIERLREDAEPAGPGGKPLARVLVRGGGAFWPGGARARGRTAGLRRSDPGRGIRAVARARRARPAGRSQRLRQDDACRGARGPPRARRRAAAPRPQGRARLPLPARRPRRRARAHGARPRAAVDRTLGGADPGPARALPVLRREVEKTLRDISGGETRRLALAILTSSDANLLILDEPTNHLDTESREALEEALVRFDGTLLLISHDRALLEAVGSRTVAIEERRLRSYSSGWAEYRAATEPVSGDAAPPEDEQPASRSKVSQGRRRPAGPSKNRRARLERLERDVEKAEAALAALEEELADPSQWADPRRSAESTRRHERARRELDTAIERWTEAAEGVGA